MRSYNLHTAPMRHLIKFSTFLNVARYTFEKCENNGFEHGILDYYCVLKGKEYHSGMQ